MWKNKFRTLLIVSFVFAAVLILVPSTVQATDHTQGCTPGFWKNHTEYWPGDHGITNIVPLFPDTFLYDVFLGLESYSLCFKKDGTPITLMDALNFKGGKGQVGAARIFLRHATAALLNMVHDGVDYRGHRYGIHEPQIIVNSVNRLLGIMQRQDMLDQADLYDMLNNWYCPLGGPIDN